MMYLNRFWVNKMKGAAYIIHRNQKNIIPSSFRLAQIIFLFFLAQATISLGQEKYIQKTGKVSLVTSRNVYVKFDNTDGINVGDTLSLSIADTIKPCLLVEYKSSISCVCIIVNSCNVKKDDVIIHHQNANATKLLNKKLNPDSVMSKRQGDDYKKKRKENIFGTISASSNSGFSDKQTDRHRMMYSLSMDAININDSKFSLETDVSYTHNFIPIESYTREKTFFRVQSIAIKYDIDSSMFISAGRQINNKISSLGALDGIQAEKHFGNFYAGLIAGFRPDIYNYNLNSSLLQYGTYLGIQADKKNGYSLSTIGFLEQRNGANIDRRYTYFQHTSTINRNLNIFSSGEVDIYSNINGIAGNKIRLTNLYLSSQYKINKWMDVFMSYDCRKQILYYETYKSEIEMYLNEDEARQGARVRLTVRPHKKIFTGIGYSKRFQNSGLNKSDNYDGYLTYTQLPLIGGSFSINVSVNRSNYLETDVLSMRHSRTMMKKKLYADIHYRILQYNTLVFEEDEIQQYVGCGFTYTTKRKIMFGISGDVAVREEEINCWINARIIKRFQKNK